MEVKNEVLCQHNITRLGLVTCAIEGKSSDIDLKLTKGFKNHPLGLIHVHFNGQRVIVKLM